MRTAVLAVLLVGCGAPAPPAAPPADPTPPTSRAAPRRDQAPPVDVSAEELWRDYERDAAAAAEKYGGRVVAVEGAVLSASADGGRAVLRLRGAADDAVAVVARHAPVGVSPRVGDRVRVVGVCTGRAPGGTAVGLDHCTPPVVAPARIPG